MLAEGNAPAVIPGIEVDGGERPPRRLDRREPAQVAPALVADELVRRDRALSAGRERAGCARGREGSAPARQIRNDRRLLLLRQIRERRHESTPALENLLYLLGREPGAHVDEGQRPVLPAPVGAVAARARRRIHGGTGAQRASRWRQPRGLAHRGDPRDIAGIDVEYPRLGVDRGAAPLPTAVEPWQHHRALTTRRRKESLPPQCAKALECRRARVRRTIGDVTLAKYLTSEGGRPERDGLCRPRLLAREVGWRRRSLLDGKERRARMTVEQEDEAALRNLRDGIDAPAVSRDRDEIGSGGEIAIPQIVVHRLIMPEAEIGRASCRERV